jgi:hypothetical protein
MNFQAKSAWGLIGTATRQQRMKDVIQLRSWQCVYAVESESEISSVSGDWLTLFLLVAERQKVGSKGGVGG